MNYRLLSALASIAASFLALGDNAIPGDVGDASMATS